MTIASKIPTLSGSAFHLLTPGNPKTAKGMKKAYMTFILHLAPASLSGWNVCPDASVGCIAACLNMAGRGGIIAKGEVTNAIQKARLRRTTHYFENRADFMHKLVLDIIKAIAWSRKHGLEPVFRLNGTSDIRWELASHEGRKLIAELFPNIQFYDYTKIRNRKNVPANYDLTFSLCEDNDVAANAALDNGMRVAAVFRTRAVVESAMDKGFELGGLPVPVIDGDDSDLRFLEPRGVIVGLYAKGPAKRDQSGFVRD